MKRVKLISAIFLINAVVQFSGCKEVTHPPLPILGQTKILKGDTVHHKIPPFLFLDQDSSEVTNKTLSSNLYIADFFFMSCPTICPKVKKQMLRIHDRYIDNDKIKLVSHTLDPKRDTPHRLKQYAENLGVKKDKWLFLCGEKSMVFDLAGSYYVTARADPDAPGGFDHSGKILLVDTNGHIRAFAEGTDRDDVTEFFGAIDRLIREYDF